MADKFDVAVKIIQSLPKDGPVKPTQADQLKFYGLYKQATVGEVDCERPGLMNFTGRAKWDAWKANEGKSADDAKVEYVAVLKEVLEKVDDPSAKEYLAQLQ